MLLVVKPAKLRVVGLRNAFLLKFNMHASTGSSTFNGVMPTSMTTANDLAIRRALEGTGVEFIDTEGGQVGIGTVGGTSLACPMFSAMWAITTQAAGAWLGQAAPLLYTLPSDAITDVLAVQGPNNVTGVIHQPPLPPTVETADDLAAPLGNTTDYVSALYNGTSTRWYVLTFGTDSSLTTGPGWDNVTGLGTPNGANFVSAVSAAIK